jgi:hypothetical protein
MSTPYLPGLDALDALRLILTDFSYTEHAL